MTRFFYDTEFLDTGTTIDLISIGVVAEDGREYYAVNKNAPWEKIYAHEWLNANVVPWLPLTPYGSVDLNDEVVKPRSQIAREVRAALLSGYAPELWAWYGAYDHIVLAQLFGTMMQWPGPLPMWTNDLRQWQHQLGVKSMPDQTDGHHNALADARFNKVRWEYLDSMQNSVEV
jgi:hypothetical protein